MATVVTTRTNNGDGTITYTVDMTANQAVADAVAEDAVRLVYPLRYQLYDGNGDPIPFDDLTNPQKIAIIGKEAKNHLVACARVYHIQSETDAAHETAVAEAETMYEIED